AVVAISILLSCNMRFLLGGGCCWYDLRWSGFCLCGDAVSGACQRIVRSPQSRRTGVFRRPVESRNDFERGALDDAAHGKLDRFQRAFANARVEEMLAQEVEHAGRKLPSDDLFL